MTSDVQFIGSIVELSIPSGAIQSIPAKVDTGADGSSIWASSIKEDDGKLSFCLFGPESEYYTGQVIKSSTFKRVRVKNSFGHSESRYSVILNVVIEGRKVKARFSLANRALKSYPALIGRRLLNKRFVVDVSLQPANT